MTRTLLFPPRVAEGRKGVVVASHPVASAAAAAALRGGGSCIDAVIAGGAALCVVLPQSTSFGGDGRIIHVSAGASDVVVVSGAGVAPAAVDVHAPIQATGISSITVPGLVSCWDIAHARWGRSPWNTLFGAALQAAAGFPMTQRLSEAISRNRPLLERDEDALALFLPGGALPQAGSTFSQPALADTIRILSDEGAKAFYSGHLGERLFHGLQKKGSTLSREDFSNYAAQFEQPLSLPVGENVVHVPGPGSIAALLLAQIGLLAKARGESATGRIASAIAAQRAAFEAIRPAIGDDVLSRRAVERMLRDADDGELGQAYRAALQSLPVPVHYPQQLGTATISAVDASGAAATHILSVFTLFGSGVLEPSTGILLHNRMAGFDEEPGINQPAPGKRPRHTLSPAVVTDGLGYKAGLATPGGLTQTVSLANVMTPYLLDNMSLERAVGLARWSLDSDGYIGTESAELAALVREAGPTLVRDVRGSRIFGSVECIDRGESGLFRAYADSRREASAVAI